MAGEELLRLAGIKKRFGDVKILQGLELRVEKGEFITLLGSSGCGKTTTIRIIAGLEEADSGQVFIDGVDISGLEPNKRGINMVFQNYALFPHMNVEQNIAYSLKLQRKPKEQIKDAVKEVLSLVRLSGYEKRKPDELSGGERQRVALARAVINKPKVLLLDEPLGALDLQLRRQMQIELKRLQKQIGITFIYITHDQEEALTMSDRIAVMHNGVFEQIGSPAQIYNYPRTAYIARFSGSVNVLSGKVKSIVNLKDENGKEKIKTGFEHPAGNGEIETETENISISEDSFIQIAIREENLSLTTAGNGTGLAAVVADRSFSGGLLRICARLEGCDEEIYASYPGIDYPLQIGDKVSVNWKASNAILLEE
jgi:spermidine/putrescine transport system ATP-binding protein